MCDNGLIYLLVCTTVARLDLEGTQAIQTEELIFEEEVDYVLSVGEERIALQPKTLQDEPVKELISVRNCNTYQKILLTRILHLVITGMCICMNM